MENENIQQTLENKTEEVAEATEENTKLNAVEEKEAELSQAEEPAKKLRKKKRRKVRMNFMYKIAFILFCIAFGLLVASMVICLVEDHPDNDSFYAILFSRISAGLATLGVIFACVSKAKKPKAKKEKKQKHKKGNK